MQTLILAAPGLTAGLLWGFASCMYKKIRLDYAQLNWWRLLAASLTALIAGLTCNPTITYTLTWAALSGFLSLGLGDTLYILSLKTAGVAIAVPIAFSYIAITQALSGLIGEKFTLGKTTGAIIALTGIAVLYIGAHRIEKKREVVQGALLAVATSLLWTAGNVALKYAQGAPLMLIVATRALAGLATITAIAKLKRVQLQTRDYSELTKLIIISIADLVLGVLLFVYSIQTVGLTLTVILVAPSPAIAQILAATLLKEKLRPQYIAGSILTITGAITATIM